MKSLDITLKNNISTFKPCQELQGQIQWSLDSEPDFLELSLFWQTAGKGTKDTGIVNTLRFENPGLLGNKDFAFKLPNGPYSFSGNLISIIWNIELALPKGKDLVRKEINISPTEQEIVCTELISDSNDNEPKNFISKFFRKFKFRSNRF